MSEPGAAKRALEMLGHGFYYPGGRGWIGLGGERANTSVRTRRLSIVGVVLLAVMLVAWSFERLLLASPVFPVLGALVFVLLWVVGRQVVLARRRPVQPLGLEIAELSPTAGHPDRVRLRGRVRALEKMASPVSRTPCIAFRLVGETSAGAVDDGNAATFELVSGKDRYRVEMGDATLDIPIGTAPSLQSVEPDLQEFLARRGLFPERGPVQLSEALVTDGDLVEVEATIDERLANEGYRHSETVCVLEDRPDAPLIVRRLAG